MADRSSFGGVLIDPIEPQAEPLREAESHPSPRLLVIGDFSGRGTGKLIRICRNNFEAVLGCFAPRLEIAPGNGRLGDITLKFSTLGDFEPDGIYRQSELFAPSRDVSGLRLYSEPGESEAAAPLNPTPEQIDRLTASGGLLNTIVKQAAAQAYSDAAPKRVEEFQSIVERVVALYAASTASAGNGRASAERVQRLSVLMAHILHDEQFQALEAAWRSLDLLVRGLDTDALIEIYLLDCTKEKLCSHLRDATAETAGRWGLLVGNFAFDRSVIAHVEMLERISLLAQALGAPFLAECLPSQHDDSKAEVAWRALRRSPAAVYMALALPRFLLRLPYGKYTARVEAFEFEEMRGGPVHTDYLWGNPAFACALALGELSGHQGSVVRVPANLCLRGMPLHIFRSAGETRTRPCAEVLLTEADCQTLLSSGVLPLANMKSSDEIVFPLIRSIADPPAALAGFPAAAR